MFDELSKRIDQQLVKLGDVINTGIIAFNELVGERKLSPVVPK